MLRIDQIPSDTFVCIMATLGMEADDLEKRIANAFSPAIAAEFTKSLVEVRAAKALLESHRYPKLAELAGMAP